MKVLYLSQTYVEAMRSIGVDIKTLTDLSVLEKHLRYNDQRNIGIETSELIKQYPFSEMELTSILDSDEVPMYIGEKEAEEISKEPQIDTNDLNAIAVTPDSLLLYVDSESAQPQLGIIEVILNSLSLIMSVDAVMKTIFFGHFAHK